MGIRYYCWNDAEFQRASPTTNEIESMACEIFGDTTVNRFLEELLEHKNPCLFVAMADSAVVGFKAGYALTRTKYYSWLGGVLPSYRGRGIAKELLRRQHQWAANAGYNVMETRTANQWKQMLILNLKCGFDIVGTYTDDKGEPKLILKKKLSDSVSIPFQK